MMEKMIILTLALVMNVIMILYLLDNTTSHKKRKRDFYSSRFDFVGSRSKRKVKEVKDPHIPPVHNWCTVTVSGVEMSIKEYLEEFHNGI